MKIHVLITEKFDNMFKNYFLPSLPDDFELIVHSREEKYETIDYYSEGFLEVTKQKCALLEKICAESQGEIFVFSDVDIQFFGNDVKHILLQELEDFDIAGQNDTNNTMCGGFFIVRANERTLQMFRQMTKNYMEDDQKTLNKHLNLVKARFLSRRFFTVAHVIGGKVWTGQEFDIPYPIVMHHANWVVGLQNKVKLLEIVKQKVTKSTSD